MRYPEIGDKVAIVTGPGQFPKYGMCEATGTIVDREETRFGTDYVIECDDENGDSPRTEYFHERYTTVGIGVYFVA
jgi:hypothetical protein